MPLTKTQSRVLGWMNNSNYYEPVGVLAFAGLGSLPEMVGVTITKERFQVHLLAVGRYAGNGKAVQMEPMQARELANQLLSLADRADQLRRKRA